MMHEVTAAPSLAYLLALAEDPCLWLLVLWICDRALIPAVRHWRARRVALPSQGAGEKKEKENGTE